MVVFIERYNSIDAMTSLDNLAMKICASASKLRAQGQIHVMSATEVDSDHFLFATMTFDNSNIKKIYQKMLLRRNTFSPVISKW